MRGMRPASIPACSKYRRLTLPFRAPMRYSKPMNITVIDHLEERGRRREVDAELAELGLAANTLNDPVNRQRIITALEKRFPKWRNDLGKDPAR